MAEQNQIPENLPIGGSNALSVKIQAPKEGLEGLKEILSSVFSKGDKTAPVSYTHLTLPTNREV